MRANQPGMMRNLGWVLVRLLVGGVAVYKAMISPLLPKACRFVPTCSEYASQALIKHGLVRGSILAARRVLRCHPWGGGGIDPVP